jgi:hypothetical protein
MYGGCHRYDPSRSGLPFHALRIAASGRFGDQGASVD